MVNKNLAKELIEQEGSGILLWMIQGCVDWQRNGLEPPTTVKEATASYFSSQDLLGEWLRECCEKDSGGWVGSTELFNSWKMWTEARQEFTGSVRGFSMKLEDRGFKKARSKDKTKSGFSGWKLKQPGAGNGTNTGNGHHPPGEVADGEELPL